MENKSSLAMPIAVVIAGIIIAVAIFISNRNNPSVPNGGQNAQEITAITATDIAINPVTEKDYIRGNPNAKVVIVEYSDTECPYCKKFHGTMKSLVEKFGKDGTIAWVYRNFPLKELHPKAQKQSEALLCAGKLGGSEVFWNYTDRIYAITPSNNGLDDAQLPAVAKEMGLNEAAFNACLSSGEMAALVAIDYEDGIKSGGSGTPYNVFIASKEFNQKEVEKFLIENILKYNFPPDLFAISKDNKRVSVSGAMPEQFMSELIAILSK